MGAGGWGGRGGGWGIIGTCKIEHSTGTMKVLFFKCTPTEEVRLCKCQFGKSKLHFELFLFPG